VAAGEWYWLGLAVPPQLFLLSSSSRVHFFRPERLLRVSLSSRERSVLRLCRAANRVTLRPLNLCAVEVLRFPRIVGHERR
jgi:hypothetical protein